MTPAYRKKLIEVAIPLQAINAASIHEKSIRHGHPSTLHLWWTRKPLATCRAVLFAQLVDDPSSLPDVFPTVEEQDAERKRIFAIIENLVKWENSTDEKVLRSARSEIRRSCGGAPPPIYDPFSGGGSITLEAQRLGLPAHGSDLNPVAVTIGKAMIEIPTRFKDMEPIHPGLKDRNRYRNAEGLAEDIKHYGEWMREKAFARIGHLYPKVDLPKAYGGGKATVIAWLWARTVPSPDPAFSDTAVPLVQSFLLNVRKGKEAWVRPIVDKAAKTIRYEICTHGTEGEIAAAKTGTKEGYGTNFRCLLSDTAIAPDYVKKIGRDGRMGRTLMAIVADGPEGRVYMAPTEEHEAIADSATPSWKPKARLPDDPRAFWTVNYGLTTFGDLFTDRQLVALNTFGDLVHEARTQIEADALAAGQGADDTPLRDGGTGAKAYAEALSVYLSFIVDKSSDYWSAICSWISSGQIIGHTFVRQGIPMVWAYAEANPYSVSSGNWTAMKDWVWKAVAHFVPASVGMELQRDAQSIPYPENAVISTNPPYYYNVGYADLSDFFYCWAKPLLKSIYPDLFGALATPKSKELIATPYRHGGKDVAEAFFLDGMRETVANMVRGSSADYPTAIYYTFKQRELETQGIVSTSWTAFLQAVVEAGYAVVGTWPMRTEMANRMIASGKNALANSVVLVCRKKDAAADTIGRAEFIRALKRELPPAIAKLQAANIAPADMPQSAVGSGMGVFSRYRSVLESNDDRMSVKTALQLINRELDAFLNDVQGEFDAATRFAIAWYKQNGMNAGHYGIADSLARAHGIAVESVKRAGIVASAAGKVRILRRDELAAAWATKTKKPLAVWAMLQYLVRLHETGGLGEDAAALLDRYDAQGNADAVKDLAYCLYDIAGNKRHDAGEATAYNALIADWTELSRMAAGVLGQDPNR